jgi:2-iminobutanoate/2-iminopropanoate deaminase
MSIERIMVEGAPPPAGAYNHAIAHGDTLYLSGQLPLDPATGSIVEGGLGEQTRQTLENLRIVLEGAGSGLDKVLSVNVYVADIEERAKMNDVYAEVFGDALPARTTVEVGPLPLGALVEINAIAAR